MKPLFATFAALIAAPALAHGGAHVHPHGAEVWLALALISAVVALTYLRHRSRK